MDSGLKDNLRILIVFAVIALTGIEVLTTHPEIWWLYAIFTAAVACILLIQAIRNKKKMQEQTITENEGTNYF